VLAVPVSKWILWLVGPWLHQLVLSRRGSALIVRWLALSALIVLPLLLLWQGRGYLGLVFLAGWW